MDICADPERYALMLFDVGSDKMKNTIVRAANSRSDEVLAFLAKEMLSDVQKGQPVKPRRRHNPT